MVTLAALWLFIGALVLVGLFFPGRHSLDRPIRPRRTMKVRPRRSIRQRGQRPPASRY